MASSTTSLYLSLSLSLTPFLKHILCFPPPPPPWSHPTCASSLQTPPAQRPSVERDSLDDSRQILEKFCYTRQMGDGWLEIHHIKDEDLENAALLVAEPYITAKQLSEGTIPLGALVMKQYIEQRLLLIPHLAILVGLYKEKDGVEGELACTAELTLDAVGAHPSVGTPRPPKDYPYIGNVAVKKTLRRRGIGSELLKACEELIIQMKAKRTVYLHCYSTTTGPLELYKRAGYKVVKKDNILVWLCLKPPRYLMSKELPQEEN